MSDTDFRLIAKPGEQGHLVLKKGFPSMFRAYLNDVERYRKCFRGDWYVTGDLARRDADGYFWFVGRADDIIKTSGHMVGPFEVESTLTQHPAVAEAAVIGKPDPNIGERRLLNARELGKGICRRWNRGNRGIRLKVTLHSAALTNRIVLPLGWVFVYYL